MTDLRSQLREQVAEALHHSARSFGHEDGGYCGYGHPNNCPDYRSAQRLAPVVIEALAPLFDENEALWDAIDCLWSELPADATRIVQEELPDLAELARHAHHRMSHEQRMVHRPNYRTVLSNLPTGAD